MKLFRRKSKPAPVLPVTTSPALEQTREQVREVIAAATEKLDAMMEALKQNPIESAKGAKP